MEYVYGASRVLTVALDGAVLCVVLEPDRR
eukprot:COSAG01_NODE_53094_length_341_cov_1.623967_1_plen_29_part_01